MVVKASVSGAAIEGTFNAFADALIGMTVRSYLNGELSVTELQEIECQVPGDEPHTLAKSRDHFHRRLGKSTLSMV